MLEKELKNVREVRQQLESKLQEVLERMPCESLPVGPGIKEAQKNKTIREAARRLADK
jgi:hypothetical protein